MIINFDNEVRTNLDINKVQIDNKYQPKTTQTNEIQ